MPRSRTDKRLRLTESAADLAYRQGFERTTLAQIAQAANVPLGNVHYYFKTREEIGEAIVSQRLAEFQGWSEVWSKAPDPKQRLLAFVDAIDDHRELLARSGCRFGTLCTELSKAGGPLAVKSRVVFGYMLAWQEAQFRDLGMGEAAAGMALHLLSTLQGAGVLANAFGNPELVTQEVARMREWIKEL